jgi:hypothetical protein
MPSVVRCRESAHHVELLMQPCSRSKTEEREQRYWQLMRQGMTNTAACVVAVDGGAMTLIVIDYTKLGTVFPSRAVPFLAFARGIVFVTIGRKVVRSAARALFVQGRGLHNVVIVGVGDLARRVAGDLD